MRQGSRAPFNGFPNDSCQRKQKVAEMWKQQLGFQAGTQALFPLKAPASIFRETGRRKAASAVILM